MRRQRRTPTATRTRTVTRTRTATPIQIVTRTRTRTPYTNSHGVTEYGTPGRGGRQPVNWTGPEPQARIGAGGRRPVVALLDTGVAEHPWLGPEHVIRNPTVLGQTIGLGEPTTAERASGVSDAMVGELQPDSGHGTFIAGLVRQACPDARLLDVRLFDNTGVVTEGELLRSLQLLALRQVLAVSGDPDAGAGRRPHDVAGLLPREPRGQGVRRPARGAARAAGGVRRGGGRVGGQRRLVAPDLPGRLRPLPGRTGRGRARTRARDGRRGPQPGRHHRAVQQRRPLGAVLPPRRGPGEHHAHDVRRLPRAHQRGPQRAGRAPGLPRPRRLLVRVRGVERDLVRGAGLRRTAGGTARDGGAAHRPGGAGRGAASCWSPCRAAATPPPCGRPRTARSRSQARPDAEVAP